FDEHGLHSVELKSGGGLAAKAQRDSLHCRHGTAKLLPQRLLGAPEMQQPVGKRASFHHASLVVRQKKVRGVLAQITKRLDVDSDRLISHGGRTVLRRVGEGNVIANGSVTAKLFLGNAAEHPFTPAFLEWKS